MSYQLQFIAIRFEGDSFLLQVVEASLAEGLGNCLHYCSPVQLQCTALAIRGGYWSAVPLGCCLKAL